MTSVYQTGPSDSTAEGEDMGLTPFHWSGPLPAPDFVMIPKLIHREILRHLSGGEWKVFYVLLVKAYEWGHPDAELSIAAIQEEAGVSRGMAQNAVKSLAGKGLITVIRHQSDEHGHEANTYRVEVTDDPRYIDRNPIPKNGIASPTTGKASPNRWDRSRARSFTAKKRPKEISTPIKQDKYYAGAYRLCPQCGALPCMCGDVP